MVKHGMWFLSPIFQAKPIYRIYLSISAGLSSQRRCMRPGDVPEGMSQRWGTPTRL